MPDLAQHFLKMDTSDRLKDWDTYDKEECLIHELAIFFADIFRERIEIFDCQDLDSRLQHIQDFINKKFPKFA